MAQRLDDSALRQLFLGARTHRAWLPIEVPDAVLVELIDLMKTRNICLSPTLMREVSTFVYEARPAFFDDPFFRKEADPKVLATLEEPARQASMASSKSAQTYKKALEVAGRNVKALHDAGIRLASGTDSGPPARFQGYFEHLELEELVKSGLTPSEALVAATGDAASCMGIANRLGIGSEKIVYTLAKHGNTSAASIPLALNQAFEDHRLSEGRLVLMEAMGGGLTWGAALARW